MAFCSHCGSELGRRDQSCEECGTNRARAGWSLTTEMCTCGEPTARGWRYCINCESATAVVEHGRSVKVDPGRVEAWFADLQPVGESSGAVTPEIVDNVGPDESTPGTGGVELISRSIASAAEAELSAADTIRREASARSAAPPVRRSAYTSAAQAAGTVQRTLFSAGIITLIAAATLWILNSRLEAFKAGAPDTFDSALAVGRLADFGTRPLVVLGVVASGWFLMRWTVIVYGNIPSFGRTSLRLPTSAVRWMFVIPGVNLFVPRRLIDGAWRGADATHFGGRDWMLQPGNRWTSPTWAGGTVAIALHLIGWRTGSSSVDSAIAAKCWVTSS